VTHPGVRRGRPGTNPVPSATGASGCSLVAPCADDRGDAPDAAHDRPHHKGRQPWEASGFQEAVTEGRQGRAHKGHGQCVQLDLAAYFIHGVEPADDRNCHRDHRNDRQQSQGNSGGAVGHGRHVGAGNHHAQHIRQHCHREFHQEAFDRLSHLRK